MTSTQPDAGEPSYPPPTLTLSKCIIRPWCKLDHESLVHAANNLNIARNMRDRFPSPYTYADAEWWISHAMEESPPQRSLAVTDPVTNAIIGGIGLELGSDVACRTAELGYWLGEEHWGNGIMGEAAKAFVDYGFREVKIKDRHGLELGLTSIFSSCYAHNKGSEAVIKKAGLSFQGVSRANAWKDGKVIDSLNYDITREEWEQKENEMK